MKWDPRSLITILGVPKRGRWSHGIAFAHALRQKLGKAWLKPTWTHKPQPPGCIHNHRILDKVHEVNASDIEKFNLKVVCKGNNILSCEPTVFLTTPTSSNKTS